MRYEILYCTHFLLEWSTWISYVPDWATFFGHECFMLRWNHLFGQFWISSNELWHDIWGALKSWWSTISAWLEDHTDQEIDEEKIIHYNHQRGLAMIDSGLSRIIIHCQTPSSDYNGLSPPHQFPDATTTISLLSWSLHYKTLPAVQPLHQHWLTHKSMDQMWPTLTLAPLFSFGQCWCSHCPLVSTPLCMQWL